MNAELNGGESHHNFPAPVLIEATLDMTSHTGLKGLAPQPAPAREISERSATILVAPSPSSVGDAIKMVALRPPLLRHLVIGSERLPLVRAARVMRRAGMKWGVILRRLKQTSSLLRFVLRVAHIEHDDDLTAEMLSPRVRYSGRKRKYVKLASDTKALRKNYLTTNRSELTGSSEEATRMARRKGELSPELLATVNAREAEGKSLLPDTLRQEIIAAPVFVKQHRNPTEAALDYFNAPGSMMWWTDPETGEQTFIKSGDVLEVDDGTINLVCCVPWEIGGDPCSDRWGVKAARFQWLLDIDAGDRFIPGYTYTARPRSSYRQEDVLHNLLEMQRRHGLWRCARLEGGTFASNSIQRALKHAGVQHWPVHSPHNKPFIEGMFNSMWTKLSDLPGQVGRFMGEMEAENDLLVKCQKGSTDPRKHFPMLASVIKAFDTAILEKNQTRVRSKNYGEWIPAERRALRLAEHPQRRLNPENEWMFYPCWPRARAEGWLVKGNCVGGSVPMMPGFSLRFDFSADWLVEFDGCAVKCFFDPDAPECEAVIVLLNDVRDRRADEVLGRAVQVNKVARYSRKVFLGLEDVDAGLGERKAAANYVRRHTRTFAAGGIASVDEVRDGQGGMARVDRESSPDGPIAVEQRDDSIRIALPPRAPRGYLTQQPTAEQSARNRTTLSALAAQARQMRELENA